MFKKFSIFFSLVLFLSISSTSSLDAFANNNNLTTNSDYEAILIPYKEAIDEFNSTHGTMYGFMTDEQLELHHIDKEKYLEDVVNEYSNISVKEFISTLEEAYRNDCESSTVNLPYYQEEELHSETQTIYHVQNPNPNGNNFYYLNIENNE